MISQPGLIYLCVVGGIGVFLLGRTYYWLHRTTRRRIRSLESRDRLYAVSASPPGEASADRVAKEIGLSGIEKQFTVTRRLLLPLVVLFTAALMAIPFLPRIPGSAVSIVVGAVTVVVGVASKPYVENAIAGLVISASKLIRIGDTVLIGEHYGTVEDITSTHTTIKIWDWRRFLVPNAAMLQEPFVNYSLRDWHYWAHVEFWVSYEADIDDVQALAIEAVRRSEYWAANEDPEFWVMKTDQEGVCCWVAGWAHSASNGWMLKHQVRLAIVKQLRERGYATHMYHHRSETLRDAQTPTGMMATKTRRETSRSIGE